MRGTSRHSNAPPPLEGLGREADRGRGEGWRPPSPILTNARHLRREATPAERRLWPRLRNGALDGVRFRRQAPIGPFIADFFCAGARLVVEQDGVSHWGSTADEARDAWMRARGLRVMRFANQEVFANLDGVVEAIRMVVWERPGVRAAMTPPPIPLPQGEGGRGCDAWGTAGGDSLGDSHVR